MNTHRTGVHPLRRRVGSSVISVVAALALASGASAAAAPSATTGSASAITMTTASVSGSLDPGGLSTGWYFEYGTTTSYGSRTAFRSAGSGGEPESESATLTGLAPGTSYHFQLVAVNGSGTSLGGDQSLTTLGAPSAQTAPVESVGPTTATLTGSVNPGGLSTSWYFEYGTTPAYGMRTAPASAGSDTAPHSESATLTGLAPGTTYHFQLVATNAARSSPGGDQSFATLGPPAAQTGAAQSVGSTTATLTGSVNPAGVSTTWYFEVGTTTSYGTTTPAENIGSGTSTLTISAPLSGLAAGTTYHYRLDATSAGGTSYGPDMTFASQLAVTLQAATVRVVHGYAVSLSGVVAADAAGVSVAMLAEPYGTSSFSQVATVVSGANGAWAYRARPGLQTTYQASANGGTSTTVIVGVAPAVSLRPISKGRLETRLSAGHSLVGRSVQLQRRSYGHWLTIGRARLNSRSEAIFSAASLRRGSSTLRIALSVNQAGAGLLAGFSRTLTYHRG
jgi:hypothetical protein